MIYDVLVELPASSSPGDGEVVQAGDAEHCVVNAVALEAEVAEDLTRKWPYEGMADCPGREAGVWEIKRV